MACVCTSVHVQCMFDTEVVWFMVCVCMCVHVQCKFDTEDWGQSPCDGVGMDGDSPQPDLCQWSVVLLVDRDLLQVVQCLPAIDHPAHHHASHTHTTDMTKKGEGGISTKLVHLPPPPPSLVSQATRIFQCEKLRMVIVEVPFLNAGTTNEIAVIV